MKDNVKNAKNKSVRVVKNAEQFTQAVALLITASFSYWALNNTENNRTTYTVVLLALILIGLRGAFETIKFLDRDQVNQSKKK